jgi:lipopolysaccharide export system protein LptA
LVAAALLSTPLWGPKVATLSAETISFSADKVESVLAKGKERTLLSGRASVKTGSISIQAERIELSGKDYTYIDCSGSVKVADSERGIRLEAPKLYYDRSRKLTRAQGPSMLEDSKNELVLKAEWIENDGKTEVTLAQVTVRILKKDLSCRAEYAVYRREDKTLELSGLPSAYKNGDEYRASRIIVNTETDEIHLEGEVSGKVVDTSKGEAGSEGTGTPPPNASPDVPEGDVPAPAPVEDEEGQP